MFSTVSGVVRIRHTPDHAILCPSRPQGNPLSPRVTKCPTGPADFSHHPLLSTSPATLIHFPLLHKAPPSSSSCSSPSSFSNSSSSSSFFSCSSSFSSYSRGDWASYPFSLGCPPSDTHVILSLSPFQVSAQVPLSKEALPNPV